MSKPVVANLDFGVAPGRRVAIVGPSGSGNRRSAGFFIGSAVHDRDAIVVLDRGAIVERGRHDDLIGHDGLYKRLAQS